MFILRASPARFLRNMAHLGSVPPPLPHRLARRTDPAVGHHVLQHKRRYVVLVTVARRYAIEKLEDFVRDSCLQGLPPDPEFGDLLDQRITLAPHDVLVDQAQIVEQLLDRYLPGWRRICANDRRGRWQQHREAARRALVQIREGDMLRETLGDNGPLLHADRFHPWVWDGARSFWQSGHYVEAVVAALKMVNSHAQAKSGRAALSETELFNQLFKLEDPKTGEPRLRIVPDDGSDTYRSIHLGARGLAEGLYRGIRNPAAHTVTTTPPDEQLALEQLAAVSVLARWVDRAKTVTA